MYIFWVAIVDNPVWVLKENFIFNSSSLAKSRLNILDSVHYLCETLTKLLNQAVEHNGVETRNFHLFRRKAEFFIARSILQ